jgi:hypothetical protein
LKPVTDFVTGSVAYPEATLTGLAFSKPLQKALKFNDYIFKL